MTLTHAYRQAQWLRNLLDEMGFGYLIRNPLLMLGHACSCRVVVYSSDFFKDHSSLDFPGMSATIV